MRFWQKDSWVKIIYNHSNLSCVLYVLRGLSFHFYETSEINLYGMYFGTWVLLIGFLWQR